LCKLLFVRHPDLLKHLVAAVLGVAADNISEFVITNPEIPPETLGNKFCRFDVNIVVDKVRVNLEVQVKNEGDYPERSLYYWAREYSSALNAGNEYSVLPRVVCISILDESLFSCEEYHSEFRPLEVSRHELLSDRMTLHYFEVRKLPKDMDVENELELLLSLFRAKTDKELDRLAALEVPIVSQAIEAYRAVMASNEFKEVERLRFLASCNEASALAQVRRTTEEAVNAKWQGVVADKDAALADKDAALAESKTALADKEAEIARLRALLSEDKR
jgi:predicted transposase/invertase (TIGR01784 family)